MPWCTYPGNETLVHQQLSLHQLHHPHPSQRLMKWFFLLHNVTRSIYVPYSGKFLGHKFRELPTHTVRKKNFCDFYFRDKVPMSDHTSYNFPQGMVILSMYFNVETIARCYHAYQNVYRPLSVRNCHDKGGGANSENVSAVVVTTSELIVGCKNFPQFAWCFYDKNRSIFCRFTGSVARRHCAGLVSTKFLEKKFLL